MWEPPEHVPTPAELVRLIDRTVAGLEKQKERLAQVLVRHALAAQQDTPSGLKNVLVLGPTGGGKTHMVREAVQALGLPWTEVNATSFTAAGFYGADLPEMFLGLFDPPWVGPGDRMKDAVTVMERWGVVILDEIDKWRVPPRKPGQPITEGRQFGLAEQDEILKIIEGDVVPLSRQRDQRGQHVFRTHRVLFIGVGAFEGLNDDMVRHYQSGETDSEYMRVQPVDIQHFGFKMELCGRFPNLLPLPPLDPTALSRVLREHVLPVYRQEAQNLCLDLVADDAAIMEIASRAIQKQVGARGFAALLEEYLWHGFAHGQPGDRVILDVPAVIGNQARLETRAVA